MDTRSDRANWGGCGIACEAGSSAVSCGAGFTTCGGAGAGDCADLDVDPDNCGGCGVRCGDAQECSAGVCGLCSPRAVTGSAVGPYPSPMPTGVGTLCGGATSGTLGLCPAVARGRLRTSPFSWADNRHGFVMTTVAPDRSTLRVTEHSGARYVARITTDEGQQVAVVTGQSSATVTVPFSQFR